VTTATEVASAAEVRPAWSDDKTLEHVRPEVRALLESSHSFHAMSPEERRELASLMVKVCAYMVNPDGTTTEALESAAAPPLAQAQADAVESTKERLAKAPGFAGKDFVGGAIKAGTQQFGELVKKVDFPKFVSGLIDGVFRAIVDTSIQQMRAYGELLANVAKTVDQFAQDNITENNTRDWLAQKYPDDLDVSTQGMGESMADTGDAAAPAPTPTPKLVVKADDQEAALKKISDDLGLDKPINDLSDEAQEHQLIMKARLQIAKSRQQLLASMVMLGINRIVVTDGLIHAKVVFDMKASDVAARQAKASMFDKQEDATTATLSASYGGWFSPINASMSATTSTDHVTTVESSVDETSESKAALKANLTGEVRVNFKSDYFPMEKLANPQMIAAIQGNAVPADKPAAAAAKA
jgi:hypothetical protein